MEINKPDITQLANKPDLSKLNGNKMQENPISLQAEAVKKDNPSLVVDADKNRWIVKVLIILICLVLAGTGLYFVLPPATSPVDISINFQLSNSSIEFLNIEGSGSIEENQRIMPGDPFLINYTISCLDDDEMIDGEEVFIRVKFYTIVDDIIYNNMISIDTAYAEWLEDWSVGADGYIYYAKTIGENQSCDMTNRLMISTSVGNEFQKKTLRIYIHAECLQAGVNGYQAIEAEWETAPILWKNQWKEVIS